jgi:hypothetical protein
MGKEKYNRARQSRLAQLAAAPEPYEPDYTDTAAEVVRDYEESWLKRAELLWLIFKRQGLTRQTEIMQEIHYEELDRLDPKGHKSVENGDTIEPKKRGGGSYGNEDSSFGSI